MSYTATHLALLSLLCTAIQFYSCDDQWALYSYFVAQHYLYSNIILETNAEIDV